MCFVICRDWARFTVLCGVSSTTDQLVVCKAFLWLIVRMHLIRLWCLTSRQNNLQNMIWWMYNYCTTVDQHRSPQFVTFCCTRSWCVYYYVTIPVWVHMFPVTFCALCIIAKMKLLFLKFFVDLIFHCSITVLTSASVTLVYHRFISLLVPICECEFYQDSVRTSKIQQPR